jgi:two-component system NtrC family sensor kinase
MPSFALMWLVLGLALLAACAAVIAVLVRRQKKLADRLRELSSRQQEAAELHHSEKLAALSRLVTGAAHELNNPLTAIMGYAELLANDFNANEEQRSFAEKIQQQTRRMRAITANLQNFAGAPLEDKKRLLEVNTILSSAMRIEELKLGTQKIVFQQQLAPDLPRVHGDEYQLLEVFMHILNNSVDELKTAGGTITAATRAEGEMVVIEFADTGRGLADPGKVFDPFYTTKEVGNGAGLGLSACYGIVKGYGGAISASNRLEGGTLISIKLPAATLADVRAEMASAN